MQEQTKPRNDMLGHNGPPANDSVIDDKYKEIAARGKQLADAAERIPSADAKGAAEGLATYIKQCKVYIKNVNEWHKETKAPHLEKGRQVDGAKNTALVVIENGMKKAAEQLQIIARRLQAAENERRRMAEEKARIAREESDRLARQAQADNDAVAAAQAEEAATIAKKAEKEAVQQTTSIKTDEGAQVSFRKKWTFEVENYNQIPVSILRKYLGDEILDKAVRGAVKDGVREIKGVRIFEDTIQAVR